MGILFISGRAPGAGGTSVCAALATAWRAKGVRVAVVKPLALAVGGADDARLFEALSLGPGAGLEARVIAAGPPDSKLVKATADELQRLSEGLDVLLVDGLPLADAKGAGVATAGALASALSARVLGVQPYAPELGADAAGTWREAFGDALAGLIINRRTQYAVHDANDRLVPVLREAGVPVLGVLPEERALLAPTVRQVADHLGAQFFTWASEDHRLVEQFIIGGLIMEWGGNYFGRYPRQAVIVRGGRIDIAMSALNFPMSCLVLTGCSEPPQYVYQRADDQEVPLVVVAQGTLEAAEALETIHQRVSIHHPAKAEHLAARLDGLLDWEAAREAAGLS